VCGAFVKSFWLFFHGHAIGRRRQRKQPDSHDRPEGQSRAVKWKIDNHNVPRTVDAMVGLKPRGGAKSDKPVADLWQWRNSKKGTTNDD
jgi:hypothetical protein